MVRTPKRPKTITIDATQIKEASLIFRAFLNKIRQEIIIQVHRLGFATVKEIYQSLDMEQSVVSLHLKLLREAGIINFKRSGRFVYYFVNYDNINRCTALAGNFAPLSTTEKTQQKKNEILIRRPRKVRPTSIKESN